MHDPMRENRRLDEQMLQGHIDCFRDLGNHPSLWSFFNKVR